MLSTKRVTILVASLFLITGAVFSAPRKAITASDSKRVTVKKDLAAEKKEPALVDSKIITNELIPAEVSPVTVQATRQNETALSSATPFDIDWYVLAAGGVFGTSTNYILNGTAGQTATGEGTSANYIASSGFWQDFGGGGGGCCVGNRGDVNSDGTDANILDLTYLVDFLFRGGPPAACDEEADVNSDGTTSNILDLTFLVDFLFRGGPAPGPC